MNLSSVLSKLYFILVPRPLALEPPRVIQFPVIDICNSRCQMCNIWENKASDDITLEQLRKGLSSGLFSNVKAIGFNGGEPTLRKDLVDLVSVVLETLPSLEAVSIITNSYKTKQVKSQIDAIAQVVKSKECSFDVMLSLDGVGNVHDTVRGKPGNFERAKGVLAFVKNHPDIDSVRIGCTVIKDNVNELHDLLDFCISEGVYIKYRLGIPHRRLYTENLVEPYALTFGEKYELIEFLEGLLSHYEIKPMQRFFYQSLIGQLRDNSPRIAGCDWKHRGATITAKGELAYCAVESDPIMADISSGDPKLEYFSKSEHLKEIVNTKCDSCNHDYEGIPSRRDYLRLILGHIIRNYQVKRYLKSLPGFSTLNSFRNLRKFKSNYEELMKVEQTVLRTSGTFKVMICGWYGTETLGDKAILGEIVHSIKCSYGKDTVINVVSLHSYVTEITKGQMEELDGVNILTVNNAMQYAYTTNLIVFGGGPMMAIHEMSTMEAIFSRATKSGAKGLIAGCGVGPLGDAFYNNSIASILSMCDYRIYRDQKSKENAISLMGISAESHDLVSDDPALSWVNRWCKEKIQNTSDKPVLLLGLREFPYSEYAAHLPESECIKISLEYEKNVLSALKIIVQKIPNVVIKPLPMCTNHFGSDDRWFYRSIFREELELHKNLDFSLLGKEESPLHYLNEFRSANAIIAMRFHSLVFALGAGLNSVSIDYTLGRGKVTAISNKYSVPMYSVDSIDPSDLANDVISALGKNNNYPIHSDLFTTSFDKVLNKVLES